MLVRVDEPRIADPCDEDMLLEAVSHERLPPARGSARGTLQRLPAIYFAGDSRVLPFRHAVYTSEHTLQPYALRSLHMRCLHAADFYSAANGLAPQLLHVLAADGTLISHDGRTWTVMRHDDLNRVPPLVLFCGPYDAHRLMDELGPDADIPAWDEASRRLQRSAPAPSGLVDAEVARQRAFEILEPVALGIEALRSIGFERIFVHGCRPDPERGDDVRDRFRRFVWHRQYRVDTFDKVRILLDEATRAIAARTGARYIAGPPNPNDVLTPDGVHYNAEGVRLVVRSVVDVLEGVVA